LIDYHIIAHNPGFPQQYPSHFTPTNTITLTIIVVVIVIIIFITTTTTTTEPSLSLFHFSGLKVFLSTSLDIPVFFCPVVHISGEAS
jgi:hypothetical protein